MCTYVPWMCYCQLLTIGFCWIRRHYRMGDIRVAYIGLWLTGTKREGRWHSFCAQEKTRWWDPQRILYVVMGQESTQISHGRNCSNSHKNTIELMKLPSKTSLNGSNLLNQLMVSSRLFLCMVCLYMDALNLKITKV